MRGPLSSVHAGVRSFFKKVTQTSLFEKKVWGWTRGVMMRAGAAVGRLTEVCACTSIAAMAIEINAALRACASIR